MVQVSEVNLDIIAVYCSRKVESELLPTKVMSTKLSYVNVVHYMKMSFHCPWFWLIQTVGDTFASSICLGDISV